MQERSPEIPETVKPSYFDSEVEKQRLVQREEYVNADPQYQSKGAKLLRGVVFDQLNPPVFKRSK